MSEEFQQAGVNTDLDLRVRIQALLLFSQVNREIDAANNLLIGGRTARDWIHRYRRV